MTETRKTVMSDRMKPSGELLAQVFLFVEGHENLGDSPDVAVEFRRNGEEFSTYTWTPLIGWTMRMEMSPMRNGHVSVQAIREALMMVEIELKEHTLVPAEEPIDISTARAERAVAQ